jgi:hypothetical protein
VASNVMLFISSFRKIGQLAPVLFMSVNESQVVLVTGVMRRNPVPSA